jgi:hypothetical protein
LISMISLRMTVGMSQRGKRDMGNAQFTMNN